MKKNIANIITGSRIVFSILLLLFPAFSVWFYTLYILCGLTDMLDGAAARKTNCESVFGSRFDTVADIVFVAICLIKLLPVLDIPVRLYIWIVIIAVIKVTNIAVGYIRQKEFISVHSAINKVTGGLLFVFPLTLTLIDIKFSSVIVCVVASIAAVYEGYLILVLRVIRE